MPPNLLYYTCRKEVNEMDEKRIAQLMKSLDCTREEAIEIIKDDEAIEKGEKLFELTDEQKKASKAMTTTGTKKRTAVKRERKVDEDKAVLMDILTDALVDSEVLITKQKTEAEMDFTFKGAEYTLKIIKHRPPKAEKKA